MGRLFWKFFLCILLAQVAATIGIGGTIWLRDHGRLRGAPVEIDSSPPAEFLMDAATLVLRHGGIEGLREMVGVMKLHTVFVLDRQGAELFGRPVTASLRERAERQAAAPGPKRPVRTVTGPNGERLLLFVPRDYLARPAPPPAARAASALAAGTVPYARGIGPRAVMAAAVAVSLLFAALLAWYVSRPIRALRSAFAAAATGDLAPRFHNRPARRGDELAQLGRDFDRMSGQLRAVMDVQRRLLHDVSHELRSPLARLQAAIGLANQRPERTPALLARIQRESERIDKLVGELLTLSRLEVRPAVRLDEHVDLADIAAQVAEDARFESGPQARIEVTGAASAIVQGDAGLLGRALENVVRNAIKHGGANVEIHLRTSGGTLHVDVLDRGPGVPYQDFPSIFEPFFRGLPAMNSVDGHGLGLPIAKRVAEAHGGAIEAANREGGGLRVTLSLPLVANGHTSSVHARDDIHAY